MHPARPAGAPVGSGRSGELLRTAMARLDEVAAALSGPPALLDAPAALAAVQDVRRSLLQLVRDPDRPSVLQRTELPADDSAAREARAACRATCAQWALPPAVASAVVDLASELVSNAARHGRGPVVLAVELGTGQVSVSVFDDGPGRPELLPYRPGLSERGLGLHLVQRLSDRWGWTGDGSGKWVWARVSLPQDPSAEQPLPARG